MSHNDDQTGAKLQPSAGSQPVSGMMDFSFLKNESEVPQPLAISLSSDSGRNTSAEQGTARVGRTTAPQAAPSLDTANRENRARRFQSYLVAYSISLTLLMLILLASGRVALFGPSRLESLPDIRTLDDGEFLKVPDDAALPEGHALQIGQTARFGDVIVRPLRVTVEPLRFVGFLSGNEDASLTTKPVLKLWIEFTNAARSYAFPPFDASLMSWRSPADGVDDSTTANSFLEISSDHRLLSPSEQPAAGLVSSGCRLLNFLHSRDSNFIIAEQNAGKVLAPGETVQTFVACSEAVVDCVTDQHSVYRWRVHFRKGIHEASGRGVTTLIDVLFGQADITRPESEIQSADIPETLHGRITGQRPTRRQRTSL